MSRLANKPFRNIYLPTCEPLNRKISGENMRLRTLVSVFAASIIFAASVTTAATVVVTNGSPENWAFDTRDAGGVVQTTGPNALTNYVNGPATPPLGTGSAHLSTPSGGGDGSGELRNTGYAGVLLSSITSLSYSTYVTTNNGQQFPYLGLMVTSTNGGDDILFFEPPYQTPATGNGSLPNQGNTAMNTWQTWDALSGAWWANNGFGGGGGTNSLPLSDYLLANPDTVIRNAGGLGGVRFNVGFANDIDNFSGYVDNFTIGVAGFNTTYDFEAAVAVPLPPAAWAGLTLLAAVVVSTKLNRSWQMHA